MSIQTLIPLIHNSPTRIVLAITGGGSRAISDLLQSPGASRTVLEAVVPYSTESLAEFLGAPCEQACSERAARAMAMAAFQRALALIGPHATSEDCQLAGVACTAALATDRPKRGSHRAYVAVQTDTYTLTATLELDKGRTRSSEEKLVAELILNEVAEACQVDERHSMRLRDVETVQLARTIADSEWRDLILGRTDATCLGPAPDEGNSTSGVIFPGAFNPRHKGHEQMALAAENILGVPVEFELSLENVDKPILDYTELSQRLSQFGADQSVWLTRAATFVEKSAVFPNTTFVVGTDTIARIADPRYYGNDAAACDEAIREIATRGCRFLVFGRSGPDRFRSLSDTDLPHNLRAICQEVRSDQFRVDISSTDLRAAEQVN